MQEGISQTRKFLTWQRLLIVALVYCIVTLSFRPTSLLGFVASGDDTSYISHAFTIGLDLDLDYRNEPIFLPGDHQMTPSGLAPAHPVGSGLMAAPFVAFFSLFDRAAGNPIITDHKNYAESWSLFGFFIAAASWFLFGLWLYLDVFEAIGAKTNKWMILLLTSGIGLSYYVLVRPTMGHAFEFSAVAMVFWGAVRLLTPGKLNRAIPEIVMVAGMLLTMLVRMADVNIILLPLIVWGLLLLSNRGKWPTLKLRSDGSVLVATGIVSLLILIGFNLALYGVAFAGIGSTYGYTPFFSIPEGGPWAVAQEAVHNLPLLWPLLVTSEYGLIYSAPILPAGCLAFVWLLVRDWSGNKWLAAVTLVACMLYAAVPLSTVLILRTTSESFGFRYLYDLLPPALLSLALFLDQGPRRLVRFAQFGLTVLSLWALLGVAFTDTSPELASRKDINSFGRYTPFSLVGYETTLLKVIATPRGWFNLAARRFPGFVAVKFGAKQDDTVRAGASLDFSNAQNTVVRIVQLRGSYVCAILLFWLLYPLCLVFLCDDVIKTEMVGLAERMHRRVFGVGQKYE